jgi:hypothetical protein
VTETSLLLDYLQSAWTLGTPNASEIVWREGWYDPQYPNKFQVTVTPFLKPVKQRFRDGSALKTMTRGMWHFNIWRFNPERGSHGSLQMGSVQAISTEVAECFRRGFANNWGGSLTAFGCLVPTDYAMPLHEREKYPRYFRYQVTLIATEHFPS